MTQVYYSLGPDHDECFIDHVIIIKHYLEMKYGGIIPIRSLTRTILILLLDSVVVDEE